MNEQVIITGTVTKSTYESLKTYLLSPAVKISFAIALVVYEAWMIYQMVTVNLWLHLVMAVLFTALIVFVFLRAQNGVIKRALENNKALRTDGILLTIHLEAQGIRMFNHNRGSERNLPYQDFVSYADTNRCIALFVKKGNFLMIPKDQLDAQQAEAVLAFLKAKMPKLKKRF